MSPFDDYTAHLFPSLPSEKITTLSCDHVIPPENLCVWTLASLTPKGNNNNNNNNSSNGTATTTDFEFSFQKRSDRAMIRDLGVAILNICAVVPDGVVVFFPSYGYLDEVVGVWGGGDNNNSNSSNDKTPIQGQGQGQGPAGATTIWQKLQMRKAVFRESKGGSSDEVLELYSRAILGGGGGDLDAVGTGTKAKTTTNTTKTTNGALLLSVVGGKMSEGINFSDRLGRCVVIVGLPYPNINSADWKARIEYVESTTVKRLLEPPPPPQTLQASNAANPTPNDNGLQSVMSETTPPTKAQAQSQAKLASRAFYENACMRAVNQSIGRAVRHRADYAAIVLLDRRFAADRVRGKLPGWIRAGLVADGEKGGLGGMMGRLSGFFRGKKGMD